MAATFSIMDGHLDAPRAPAPEGRVVFSRLPRGESAIVAAATSMKYVLEGEERYEIDGVIRVVEAGHILIVEPGVGMRAILPRSQITTGACVYLPGRPAAASEPCSEFAALLGRSIVIPGSGSVLGAVLRAAARAMASGRAPRDPDRLLRRAGGGLSCLVRDADTRMDRLSALKASTRRELLRRLEVARHYLHTRPDRAVPLGELAVQAGLSQFHLARSFREVYDRPPAAYHSALRLDAAARFLQRGRGSSADAAEQFGFSDPRAFARAFQRRHGRSPAVFARN